MHVKKKKSIEELETELEQLIANSGQSEVDIRTNYNAYYALKKRIDNPDSCHDDDSIWRMKDLHDVYILGVSIRNRQKKCRPQGRRRRHHRRHYCRRCHCHIQRYEYLHIIICIYFDKW
jgi:hypothetical protein